MGRYNFAPQNVHKHASQLLQVKGLPTSPPWYESIGTTPPSQRLVRPAMQRPQVAGKKKASRMFKPVQLKYAEDHLRYEYFNDHPWELARPRVLLEKDGKDHQTWDWSLPLDHALNRPKAGQLDTFGRRTDNVWDRSNAVQSSRPIDGESVVQRQSWLMAHTSMSPAAAYDTARKEFYRYRHSQEVEQRVAREEAQAVGAFFGLGPLEIGMRIEDQKYETWRKWAEKETSNMRHLNEAAISGDTSVEEEASSTDEGPTEAEAEAVAQAVPASKAGQLARGGASIHP